MSTVTKAYVERSSYQRQPMSTINDGVKTIWYTQRVIAEGNRKYVKLHQEDRDYIYKFMQRFIADFAQLQFLNPELWKMFYQPMEDCGPMGKQYQKITGETYNSLNSLVAGYLSNKGRNPDVDFTQKQLNQIRFVFEVMNVCYTQYPKEFRLGYGKTGNNEMPLQLKFRKA